ncbi:MAG TPA: rRNA maturation RNase YbeY [Lacipirellulaceae bacterium]|jgi:probable rRNA maturation factor
MPHGPAASDISTPGQSELGFELSLANQQSVHSVDEERLLLAARSVLEDSQFKSATISIAIVDDATIHALNRQFLEHDYPTDVLSFTLDNRNGHLDGEIVLSADTAATAAHEHGTTAAEEQLHYVIHGILHLVGYDDIAAADATKMRDAEQRYLRSLGAGGGAQQ